jgi:hypothetical protein
MSSDASDRTAVTQRYGVSSAADGAAIRLATDLARDPVRAVGSVRDAVALRAALGVLHGVVQSDLRYKPKDRAAYMAHQRMRKQGAGAGSATAQRDYFAWLARNDPMAWFVLDPVVTVQPDGVLFEVFSKDEGSYAALSLSKTALDIEGPWVCGTTNIDFSDALAAGVQRMRSYREVRLEIAPDQVALGTDDERVVQKKVAVPNSWLRGFSQVTASASLGRAVVHLSPMDLYNVLLQMRMHADEKRKGRALRLELVPGEYPRLVLEPWSWMLQTDTAVYQGAKPEVIKIWGRRRWMLVRPLLPFVERVELHLLGTGMPSFLVLHAGPIQLTLGLTGFTAANWSRSLQFDLLLPRGAQDEQSGAVLQALAKRSCATVAELAKDAGVTKAEALAALQAGAQRGLVMVDLAAGGYRARALTAQPLDAAKLAYRTGAERDAWALIDAGAVQLKKEDRVHGTGVVLVGAVDVAADKRQYRPELTIGDEGQVRRASCTCAFYRTHKLKEGPCAHLVAIRLRFGGLELSRASRRATRKGITTETRTYSRRQGEAEQVTQISLDKKRLRIRWGDRKAPRLRVQNLVFDTPADARAVYFERIDRLEAKGYLDASAS